MINVIVGTSILILAILLIRKIFWKKCSPNVLYFLWIFVAFRILIPVNIPLELPDNSFGRMLVPDYGVENDYEKKGFSAGRSGSELNTSISGIDITEKNDVINIDEMQKDDRSSVSEEDNEADNSSVREEADIYSETKTFTKIKSAILNRTVLMAVWLTGSLFFAVYFFVVNRNLFKNVRKKKIGTIEGKIEVFVVESYNCLYGIRNPQIFLSPEIVRNPVYKEYVLMHELEHYRMKDNFWLLIRTMCLTVQWFNPLVWIAYYKMREDCELACDYRVLSKLEKEEKSDYGKALLYILETNQKTVSMASSMGREKQIIRKRIESIFKKREAEAYLIPLVAVCIVTVLAFVQPTLSGGTKQIDKKTELPHTEVVEQEGMIPGLQEKEQVQNENSSVWHNSDSAEGVTEQEYELLIESIEDLERDINLHYSNCYTTNLERGSNHFWIDEKGILWGEGTSEYGQLGILKEDLSVVEEPVKIAENVIHVDFSGEYFTIYLTSDYKLYGLGASPAGILTQSGKWDFSDADMEIATEPVLLMNNVVFAQSGYTSIIALLENGDVYVLGNNEYIPYQNAGYIAPRKVMEKAKYVTTYFHTYAAIDESNNLWAWGHNELGQCGMGAYTASVAAPQKIMEDVECVWMGQAGFNHTDSVKVYDNLIVLKKDGNFYGCGEGIGESRLVKGVNDLMNEESEVISSNHFCKINIKEYVPPSLKDAELLWKEEELKDFLENSRVKYYVSRTEDEGYLLYVAKEEDWEFIFNKEGLLADITSYRNDELEEDRLKEMDSFAKIINCYGEDYKKIDAEYGHFVMEYEREDYDFRIFVYSDLGCGRFSKVLKGFYE